MSNQKSNLPLYVVITHPDVFMGVFHSAYSAVEAFRKRVVKWEWKTERDTWETLTKENAEDLAEKYGPALYHTSEMYDMVIHRVNKLGFMDDGI